MSKKLREAARLACSYLESAPGGFDDDARRMVHALSEGLDADAWERRDLFAASALNGYRANPQIQNDDSDHDATIIEWSVRDADALLDALDKPAGS